MKKMPVLVATLLFITPAASATPLGTVGRATILTMGKG